MPTPYSKLDLALSQFKGVNLNADPSQLDIGEFTLLQNVYDSVEGQLITRPGCTQLGTLSAGAPIHSLFFLNDSVNNRTLYVAGAGTSLYNVMTGAVLVTGLSGNPVTGVTYRLSGTAAPCLIIGDSNKMVKIFSDGTVWQLGITPDPDTPTEIVLNFLTLNIDTFETTTGLVFGNASASGLYSVAMSSLTRASGIVTAVASGTENFVPGLQVFMHGTGGDPSWYGIFGVDEVVSTSSWKYFQPAANASLSGGTAIGGVTATAVAGATLTIAKVQSLDLTQIMTINGEIPTGETVDTVPSSDNDPIRMWIYVDAIAKVSDVQIQFDVDPSSVSGGSLTATAFMWNYYYASIFTQLATGWNLITVPKSSFTRVGQGVYDWSGVVAWQVQVIPNTGDSPTVILNNLILRGSSYADSSVGVGYDWRPTYYNSVTQSESNPAPVVDVLAYPVGQAVGLVPANYSTDPQVNKIRWYRRGGSLSSDWYFLDEQNSQPIRTISASPTGVVMNATGSEATITTDVAHGFKTNDIVYMAGIPSGAYVLSESHSYTAKPTVVSQASRHNDWVNPDNALSNSAYATCTLYGSNSSVNKSSILQFTGFDFSAVPENATISKIEVSWTRYQSAGTSTTYDDIIQLIGVSGNVTNAAQPYPDNPWPHTAGSISYTGPWGVLPTMYELQSSTFGVYIGAECTQSPGSGADLNLNNVTITVYFNTKPQDAFNGFFQISSVPTDDSFVVPNTWAGGGVTTGGGTAQLAFIDAYSDAEISAAPTLSLDNDVPVTTVDTAGTIVYAQPLSKIWGPYGGTEVFGCGDPYAPGNAYWCNSTNPDGWSSTNYVEVSQPSDPLLNGCYWQGTPWARSSESLYQGIVSPIGGQAGYYVFQDVGSGESLGTPWGLIGGSGIPFMPWVGKSGIFIGQGGTGESVTDNFLWPLFDPKSTRTDAVDWTSPYNRLAWYDHHLRWSYMGKDGTLRFYVLNVEKKRWIGPSVWAFGGTLEYVQPDTTESLLIGGQNGKVYQYDTSASTDAGTAIAPLVQGPVYIPAGWQNVEEWGSLSVDAAAPVGGISVKASFNSSLTSYLLIGTCSSLTRAATPFSLGDQYSRGMSLQLTWIGYGVLYGWTVFWRDQGVPVTHAETVGSSYGSAHFSHAYKASVALISTGIVNLTLWVDNVALAVQPIPSTAGSRLRQDVYFPVNKGQLFRLSLDAATANQGFLIFAEDCSLEVQNWESIQPTMVQLPFVGGGPG